MFPANQSALVDALVGDQCGQAAKLLGAANGSTLIANQVFNEQINSLFGAIEKEIATNLSSPFSIHLQAFAPSTPLDSALRAMETTGRSVMVE